MTERLITRQAEFDDFCLSLRKAESVGFDTEFISEATYLPRLCLLQLATDEQSVAVDALEVPRLDAWWELMINDETEIIVHGGREEVRFCYSATGQVPGRFVDVQLAAGLLDRSYPLAYSSLVQRVTGERTHGKATRTDWSRRPLSNEQIVYAIEDVLHLLPVWRKQQEMLKDLGRQSWVAEEFQNYLETLRSDFTDEKWHKLPGINKLKSRDLAIARELYRWREQRARETNRAPRRILRDDLLMEMVHRRPQTKADVLATRDMQRRDFKRLADDILACVQSGLDIPDKDCPPRLARSEGNQSHDEQVLGKFLSLALANRCAELNVALSLVGTSADLRELVRWHIQQHDKGDPPRITQGWRAEVCGNLLTDVLDGKISIRVADPSSDHPLVFEKADHD